MRRFHVGGPRRCRRGHHQLPTWPAAEIAFTFNRFNSDDPGGLVLYDPEDPVVRGLSQRWSDTVIAFAKTGDPNGGGLPHWPRYDAQSRQTLILDAEVRVERDPDKIERQLWEGFSSDG